MWMLTTALPCWQARTSEEIDEWCCILEVAAILGVTI